MDRAEFAASLSDEQREFIEETRDAFIRDAETCYECYKSFDKEYYFDELTYSIYSANVLTFILNAPLTSAIQKIEEAYVDLIDKRKGK